MTIEEDMSTLPNSVGGVSGGGGSATDGRRIVRVVRMCGERRVPCESVAGLRVPCESVAGLADRGVQRQSKQRQSVQRQSEQRQSRDTRNDTDRDTDIVIDVDIDDIDIEDSEDCRHDQAFIDQWFSVALGIQH